MRAASAPFSGAADGRSPSTRSSPRPWRCSSFAPPAALELGNATGFDVRLVDRAGLGHDALMNARNQLLGMSMQSPVLAKVRPNGLDDTPEYHLDIDQEKASALGLSLGEINAT